VHSMNQKSKLGSKDSIVGDLDVHDDKLCIVT